MEYDDQEDEIQCHFVRLCNAIISTNDNSSEEDIRALNELIQREVTAKPNLAKIIKYEVETVCYLLLVACANLDDEQFHPAIKCLIEANPSALLWYSNTGKIVIHKIAGHSTHCLLMPWIATNYQWVLDDEICLEDPPVIDLLCQYNNRRETRCTSTTIQQFFEAYPLGLNQDTRGRTPLHIILTGSECEPALVRWMAEKSPSNMLKQDNRGFTPLSTACFHIFHMNNHLICKYLISKCPESVRILNDSERLPIHYLLEHCQHRPVKAVVVLLLRAYPESYYMASEITAAPSSIPLIQRIQSLLDEERELQENVAYLREVSESFHDAVEGTENPSPLASSTCEIFCNWATVTFVKRLEVKMEHISMQLQHE